MYAKIVKPSLDRVVAATLLAILAVPLLLIAIWIKLDSHGPVIFKQPRFGKNKVTFMVYKFRTMATDTPQVSTNTFKNAHAYITRSGKILRKLSIDELPQILNVLKGEMSLVGPRPVILKEIGLIDLREQVGANSVKPGITGWAQVNGRDELNDVVKSRMDGEYVKNLSFTTDLKCILKTFYVALSLAGHTEGHERDWLVTETATGAKFYTNGTRNIEVDMMSTRCKNGR